MIKEEIIRALKGSDRWGRNARPTLEVIVNFLETLPVVRAEILETDVIAIEVDRDLSPSQAYGLAQLGQDMPNRIEDHQRVFLLFWD